jgi:hypothetical protein
MSVVIGSTMAYVEPATVWAPKASIRSVEVLYSRGQGEWSVARVVWEGAERIGVRWNGSNDAPGIGNPQSRGNATWFILPKELESAVLDKVEELSQSGPGGLLEQYAEMASDQAREREAEEWSEGLIGDASAQG